MFSRLLLFVILFAGSTGWTQTCGATYYCEATCGYYDAPSGCKIGYEYVYADGASMSTTFDKMKAKCLALANQEGKGCTHPPWLEVVGGIVEAFPSASCIPVP